MVAVAKKFFRVNRCPLFVDSPVRKKSSPDSVLASSVCSTKAIPISAMILPILVGDSFSYACCLQCYLKMHTREVERYSIKFVGFFVEDMIGRFAGGKRYVFLVAIMFKLSSRGDVCVCDDAKNEAAIFDCVQNIYLG